MPTREGFTREGVFPRTVQCSFADIVTQATNAASDETWLNGDNVVDPEAAAVFSFLPTPGITIDNTPLAFRGLALISGVYECQFEAILYSDLAAIPRVALTDGAGTTIYWEHDSLDDGGIDTMPADQQVCLTAHFFVELTAPNTICLHMASGTAATDTFDASNMRLSVKKIASR